MTNLTVKGNASGTGTFTLTTANSASNFTHTLPAATGTLATTADVTSEVATAEGTVLLGTLTLTGLASHSLTGQDLTLYKHLLLEVNQASHDSGSNQDLMVGGATIIQAIAASNSVRGRVMVSLWTGLALATLSKTAIPAVPESLIDNTGYTNPDTTITFSVSGGQFDNGTVRVWGIK
jgi:hypothetical protein